jgi:CO dehydrogenase nickel-insertion accessory protein CooC1
MCIYIVENEQKALKSRSGYIIKTMVMNKTQEKDFPVKSKLIAIWGSPNSGKTSFSAKLAQFIYENYSAAVLMLSTDNETPILPILFTNYKSSDLFSVGVSLAKTEITQDEVLKSINTIKGKINLGFLGYKEGENKYSYPSYDYNKANALLSVLKELVDFVIVDCTSSLTNVLSEAAVEKSDSVIRLVTPDLKCMSFFSSQMPLYSDPKYKIEQQIVVVNEIESQPIMPVQDAITHFKKVDFALPYCKKIRQQALDGQLISKTKKKEYFDILKLIAERVVYYVATY